MYLIYTTVPINDFCHMPLCRGKESSREHEQQLDTGEDSACSTALRLTLSKMEN